MYIVYSPPCLDRDPLNQTIEHCCFCNFTQEAEKTKKELEVKKEAYKRLKKECQKQKQWIAEYQLLIRAGASGSHKVLFVCALGVVLEEVRLDFQLLFGKRACTPFPNSSRGGTETEYERVAEIKPRCEEEEMGHLQWLYFVPVDCKLKRNMNTEFLILMCDNIQA